MTQNQIFETKFPKPVNDILEMIKLNKCAGMRDDDDADDDDDVTKNCQSFFTFSNKSCHESALVLSLLLKVISGGQTGADRAGLEAAKAVGLMTGGVAPRNFQTLKGADWTLQSEFGLTQLPAAPAGRRRLSLSQMYVQRSQRNVDNSDVTLAFRLHRGIGTDKSIGYAKTKRWQTIDDSVVGWYRPYLIVRNVTQVEKAVESIVEFIIAHEARTVNVCGHRDDSLEAFNRPYDTFWS
jgi:hypothetical protein